MSGTAKAVLKEAMRLADDERAEVVTELLDSLSPKDTRGNDEWIAEVERRSREALAGSSGMSWEEARDRVTESLARK